MEKRSTKPVNLKTEINKENRYISKINHRISPARYFESCGHKLKTSFSPELVFVWEKLEGDLFRHPLFHKYPDC